MGCAASKEEPSPAAVDKPRSKSPVTATPAASSKSVNVANTVLGKQLADVTAEYSLGKVLGRGQFGTTRVAELKGKGKEYACKSIAKRKLTCQEDVDDVRREVQIMHHLKGHENITYLQGAYEDRQAVHLVMDLCSGGELFDRIVAKGSYSEKDAAALIRDMVRVVAHCHHMGVIHRDLKPENFLLESKADDASIKCTDFGLSVFFKPGQTFKEVVGSAYYVAPEVLKQSYSMEADIWSCGVILYILLSGVPPFWGETEKQIFKAILEGNLDLVTDPWPKISKEAKDCVKRMLEPRPSKRATADEILQHPWMRENGVANDKPLDNVILQRMTTFANHNKLKRQAMKVIASAMPADEIAGLAQIFKSIDADDSGTITAEELSAALKGSLLKQEDLEGLLALVDQDSSGCIDYEEFLAATLSQHQMEKEENMRAAFQHFDIDNSGTINKDELRQALQSGVAANVVDDEVEAILNEVDKNGDGQIDYEEFVALMTGRQEIKMLPLTKRMGSRGNLNAYKAAHNRGL
ncbi:hypothetical protein D9Q98_000813 [Chlorella vulgaris]|uniref:non-specific serine/threonine protein kinase n=1 Tax=Chlorella vulgaris TaxID=3077 RepID=A0A9D4TYR1_CHLVU|nr:hypothetical protein D9Q98_000813 [Chlorella vulgaris]